MKDKWIKNSLLKESKTISVISTIVSLLVVALEFIGPLTSNLYLNELSDTKMVIFSILFVIGCYLLSGVIRFFYIIIKNKISVSVKVNMLNIMLEKMINIKYDNLIKNESTYLFDRILICTSTLFKYYTETIPDFIISVITILSCIISAFFINIYLIPVFAILFLIQLFGYKKLNKKLSKMCMTLSEKSAIKFSVATSILSNCEYIKQLPSHTDLIKYINEKERDEKKEEAKINIFAGGISSVFDTFVSLINYGIYIIAPVLLFMGHISIGESIFLSAINSLFYTGVKKLTSCNLNFSEVKATKQFIYDEILKHQENTTFGNDYGDISEIDIDIQKMKMGNKILLKNGRVISLKNGNIYKLEGETGCGKSTLVKTLVRFYDIPKIYYNKIDIKEWNINDVRKRIMYIPQNSSVFSGTVAENILFSTIDNANKLNDLKEKLNKSNFGKYFINNLDYENKIMENGSNISGGEKQKIAIARIFLNNWDVLILDEATSAMDCYTENDILQILKTYAKENDKIIIIISHSSEIDKHCTKRISIENKTINMTDIS